MNDQMDIERDEYVTIIGATMSDVMREFRTQGLAEKNYSIVSRVGHHQFTLAGQQSEQMFAGEPMLAATFRRTAR